MNQPSPITPPRPMQDNAIINRLHGLVAASVRSVSQPLGHHDHEVHFEPDFVPSSQDVPASPPESAHRLRMTMTVALTEAFISMPLLISCTIFKFSLVWSLFFPLHRVSLIAYTLVDRDLIIVIFVPLVGRNSHSFDSIVQHVRGETKQKSQCRNFCRQVFTKLLGRLVRKLALLS